MKHISQFYLHLVLYFIVIGFKSYAQNFWEKANGPLPWSIISFAINKQGDLFAGTSGGGVFRSIDNGDNWTAINNGISNKSMYAQSLAVGAHGIVCAVINNALYRSINNGDNWTATNVYTVNSSDMSGTAIIINKKGYVFAGLNDLSHGYLYRSTDVGQSWIKLNFVFGKITDLKLNSNDDIIVAGDMQFSTDDGDSWLKMKTGGDSGLNQEQVMHVAVDTKGNIFAGTYRGGIFLSTDNGFSWKEISTGIPKPYPGVTDLEMNARGDIFCVLVNGSVYRSSNDGALWKQVFTGYPDEFITRYYPILITPTGDIFKSSRVGLYRSEDNGTQWTKIDNSLPSTKVWSLLTDSRGFIYAGSWYGGIFRSTDNGYNWNQIGFGNAYPSSWSLLTNSKNQLFVGNTHLGVYRSTDNGKTWMQKNNGCDTVVKAMALHPNGNIFIGTADSGIYRSTDDGDSWIQMNNGLTYKHITSLAVTKSGFVFVGTDGCMYRSSDAGESWVQLVNAPPSPYIMMHSNGNIYCGNYLGQLSLSTDNGNTWTSMEIQKDLSWVQSLAYDSRGYIYAGMQKAGGIFRSTDYGMSWKDVNDGLPSGNYFDWPTVNSIIYNINSGSLFAGTCAGVYRSTNLLTSIKDVNIHLPSSIVLSQNFPNPFSSATTIKFDLTPALSYEAMHYPQLNGYYHNFV